MQMGHGSGSAQSQINAEGRAEQERRMLAVGRRQQFESIEVALDIIDLRVEELRNIYQEDIHYFIQHGSSLLKKLHKTRPASQNSKQVLKLEQYVKEGRNALLYINRCHDTDHVPSAKSLRSLEHTLIRVHRASNTLQVMIRDNSSTQQNNNPYGPGGGAGGSGGSGAASSAAATGATSAASIPTEISRQFSGNQGYRPAHSTIPQASPTLNPLQRQGSGVVSPVDCLSFSLDPHDSILDLEPIPLPDITAFGTPTPTPAQEQQQHEQQQQQMGHGSGSAQSQIDAEDRAKQERSLRAEELRNIYQEDIHYFVQHGSSLLKKLHKTRPASQISEQVLKVEQYVKEGRNALLYINRCHDTDHVPSAKSLRSLEHTLIRVHNASNALQVMIRDHSRTQQNNNPYGPGGGGGGSGGPSGGGSGGASSAAASAVTSAASIPTEISRQFSGDQRYIPPHSSIPQVSPTLSLLQQQGSGVVSPVNSLPTSLDPHDSFLGLEPIPLPDNTAFGSPTPTPAQKQQKHKQRQQQVLLRRHQTGHGSGSAQSQIDVEDRAKQERSLRAEELRNIYQEDIRYFVLHGSSLLKKLHKTRQASHNSEQVPKLEQYVKEGHNALLYINRCHDTDHVPSAASLHSLEHTLIRVHKASNVLQVMIRDHSRTQQNGIPYGPGGGGGGADGSGGAGGSGGGGAAQRSCNRSHPSRQHPNRDFPTVLRRPRVQPGPFDQSDPEPSPAAGKRGRESGNPLPTSLDPRDSILDLEPIPLRDNAAFGSPTPTPPQEQQQQHYQQRQQQHQQQQQQQQQMGHGSSSAQSQINAEGRAEQERSLRGRGGAQHLPGGYPPPPSTRSLPSQGAAQDQTRLPNLGADPEEDLAP